MNINDDLDKLIENLPFFLQEQLNQYNDKDQLIEIVLDLGRRPEARFSIGHTISFSKNYFMAGYRLYNKTN
jgi:stage III sporulation protein SpoIIIAA